MKIKYLWSLWIVPFLLLTGCSNQVDLGGKVVFSDDKTPVPCGTVCFTNDNFLARGDIKDGVFVMGSLESDDGLPPGTYHVFFADVTEQTGTDNSGEPVYTSLIDTKYLRSETSGIEKTVDKETGSIDFELDRNPQFKKR